MPFHVKDLTTGLTFICIGLFYGYMSFGLPIGVAHEMGPGYVPLVLSSVLAAIGLAVCIRGMLASGATRFGRVPWRAIFFLSAAVALFASLLDRLGLLPAVFLTSLVASMASRDVRIGRALSVSSGLAVVSTLIFSRGVRLPVPVFGNWFN
jgi:hypothetical protein